MALHASPPTIASAQIFGGNLQLQATGGVPYDPCFILTCTNLSSPVEWQYVSTNTFNSTGNALISLPVSPIEPARFYRLQVD
jgi:hypothetical protein